jgi:hypothetical protein
MKKFIFTILFILVTSLSAWAGELTKVPYPSNLDDYRVPSITDLRHVVFDNGCFYKQLTAAQKEQIAQDYLEAFKKHYERIQFMKTWTYYSDGPFLYVLDPTDGKMKNAGAMKAGFGVSVVRHPEVKMYTHSVIIHLSKCK